MYFFIVFIILAFALSANAASFNKRDDVSTPAQTCINSLVTLNQALVNLDSAASTITASQGYAGMLLLHSKEQLVESNITATGTSCCAITSTLTASDAASVLSEESTVADSFTSMTNTFINTAKSQIYQVLLMPVIFKADFSNMYNKSTPVLTCLTAMMPSDSTSTAQGYSTSILNSLQQGLIAYNNTTVTPATTTAA